MVYDLWFQRLQSASFLYLPKCCNIRVHSVLSKVKASLGFTSTSSFPTLELYILY